ncbi:UbiA family prenyltransferase [Aeoliella sp. SH292]|uniref:UbiA family prenyltransferase n=1 Tax=Aeoliella sp. SH292 TaxID=3454464 RepID=UPI003F98036F
MLQVARPGLWSTHLWFYLLPLGGYRVLDTLGFWLGAVYVTFPLGLLLYGWNDWADYETDSRNPRKGNVLFGARLSKPSLAKLPWWIAVVQVPFFIAFIWLVGAKFLLWIAAAVVVNTLYNSPRLDFKGRPLLDVLCQSGYLLVFVLASWVNDVPQLPWPVFIFGMLFAMHSHLLGETADVGPDRAAGRRTTAVVIGVRWTKLVVAALLFIEAGVLANWVGDVSTSYEAELARRWVVGFLALAGLGFLIDAAVHGNRAIPARHLAIVLIVWNLVAIASMYAVWRAGFFVQ